MDRLTIHTGRNDFLLIDSLTHVMDETIRGIRLFSNDPVFLGIESLAQLGAMHVRFKTGFEKHAFLLKINHCRLPDGKSLTGKFSLAGTLISQSSRAFAYTLKASAESRKDIEGEFLFATVDYNKNFKQNILKDHYKNIFSCLQTASKTG